MEYEFYRDEEGVLHAKPKEPALNEIEEQEQAIKDYEKNKRNEKVDKRREALKNTGSKIGNALKKTGKYLSETELAKQSKEKNDKEKSMRYRFEEKDDWI